MREVHLRIRNIDEDKYHQLKHEALIKTGSKSVAGLAKKLLMDLLNIKTEPKVSVDSPTTRIEVRLPKPELEQLINLSAQSHMTPNAFIAMLMQGYLSGDPVMTTKEVEALYQSNQQLLAIGRNLNQIARALNANQSASLSLKFLQELEETITQHTQKVGHIISNNWDRMP